jgi:hypothetical protein
MAAAIAAKAANAAKHPFARRFIGKPLTYSATAGTGPASGRDEAAFMSIKHKAQRDLHYGCMDMRRNLRAAK